MSEIKTLSNRNLVIRGLVGKCLKFIEESNFNDSGAEKVMKIYADVALRKLGCTPDEWLNAVACHKLKQIKR